MTNKIGVLAVAALGALVAGGSSGARASDDSSTQPESNRLVWKTSRGDGFAQALSISATADPKGNSVITSRDLILTPASGLLVVTETTYMRRDLTRFRLLDEKTGWWVQLETATGLDLGSFEHLNTQGVDDLKRQLARERQADPWRTYALTGTGGLRFSTRTKANDLSGSAERALDRAIAQSHLLDGISASPVGEELIFLGTLWRKNVPPPDPTAVQLIEALNRALAKTPELERAAKAYADGSWERLESPPATGFTGGQDRALADAFIQFFKSVSPTNPLADAGH